MKRFKVRGGERDSNEPLAKKASLIPPGSKHRAFRYTNFQLKELKTKVLKFNYLKSVEMNACLKVGKLNLLHLFTKNKL